MRWGIFWRKLVFSVDQVGRIVTAAMLIHNFIVDTREINTELLNQETSYFRSFLLTEQDDRALLSNEAPAAAASDNNEPHPGGRPTTVQLDLQARGVKKREELTIALYGSGRTCPIKDDMRFNSYGQIYFA